jgi:hypothetical protein
MNKNQLAAALRSEISDDEVILAALTRPDCGDQLPCDKAIALAAQVKSLEEWYGLLELLEDQLESPPRLLPSAAAVSAHCRALAAKAFKRRSRN